MEHLRREIDSLLSRSPNEHDIRERLNSLVSIYPFNDYEYVISNLLSTGVLTLDAYHELRDNYIARNLYLYVFEISAPRTFGESWAQGQLKSLIPALQKPSKSLDLEYSGQYDFYLDGIRIEVKASRAVDSDVSKGPLYERALASDSEKGFLMNFQQLKPYCCDVFVWVAVWRDVIRYWVLSSNEVETNPYYSRGQHRGNTGEGQLHVRPDNIHDLSGYEVLPNALERAIRDAHDRQHNR